MGCDGSWDCEGTVWVVTKVSMIRAERCHRESNRVRRGRCLRQVNGSDLSRSCRRISSCEPYQRETAARFMDVETV